MDPGVCSRQALFEDNSRFPPKHLAQASGVAADGGGALHAAGHVPASDLQRLLRERPKAKGLVVPGMPPGSPGMEVPSGRFAAYEVLLVALDGTTTVFAKHGGN